MVISAEKPIPLYSVLIFLGFSNGFKYLLNKFLSFLDTFHSHIDRPMDLFLCRGALVRGVDGSEADVLEVDRGVGLRVLDVRGFSRVVGAGPAVAAGHLTGRDCTVITYH